MIANNLNSYRKAKNLSQSKLSEISHVPQTTISGWELGLKEEHAIYRAIRIARVLDTNVEKLFPALSASPERTDKTSRPRQDGQQEK